MNILEIDNFAKENNVSIRLDFYSWANPLISMKREDLYTERTLNIDILKLFDNDRLILAFLKDMIEELDAFVKCNGSIIEANKEKMTSEEAETWLKKLYTRADITDDYGEMVDMQPYEEAVNMAIDAIRREQKFIDAGFKDS